MPSTAAVHCGRVFACECVCVRALKIFLTVIGIQIKLHLIAFIFAPLTISRMRSNPSSLNLLHHGCHSNIWATNWFSLPCWFPYQAYCQHGRRGALRVTLLLQQIWWIAQTVSSSPMQTCGRGECLCQGTFSSHCAILCCSHNGLLDLVFQSCAHVVPPVL